ncbi:MAG: PACE efflux transporter [Hydrogenophilus sp.]|nr:PACE efflux transporter [Hydrogenophilus sp.]
MREVVLVRSWPERALQVGLFELGGMAVITPLFQWASGEEWGSSVGLLVALSAIAVGWQWGFNTAFDWAEARWMRRRADARPFWGRVAHAVGFEGSLFLVTWPVVVAWTGWDWWTAAVADVGLAMAYAIYAFLFHWWFDRWRPVGKGEK